MKTTIACLKTVVFQPLKHFKTLTFHRCPMAFKCFSPINWGSKNKPQLQPTAVSTLALICSFITSQLCTWPMAASYRMAAGHGLRDGGWTMAVPPFMDGLWWKKNGKHQLRWNGISNDFEEININILIHRNCWKKPKYQHVDHWMAAICWCLVLNMAECRFWTCAVRNRNQSNGRIWARWNPFRSSWELPLVGGVWF